MKKKIRLSKIMGHAWNIARMGAEMFGGSSKSYFACSLKIAWGEEKNLLLAQEKPITVWRKGVGCQFLLGGLPVPMSVSQTGQLGLPGICI